MDPITVAFAGLAAVQKTVSLIKKASATVDDVKSLGPLLGKYFDQKHETTKALRKAKKTGSNMGRAIEIELALKQQADFENELKMLFFQTGNADVWQAIQVRVAQMNRDDAHEARREKEEAARKSKEFWETVQAAIGVGIITIVVGVMSILAYLGLRK
jgi:hypothetical protein